MNVLALLSRVKETMVCGFRAAWSELRAPEGRARLLRSPMARSVLLGGLVGLACGAIALVAPVTGSVTLPVAIGVAFAVAYAPTSPADPMTETVDPIAEKMNGASFRRQRASTVGDW